MGNELPIVLSAKEEKHGAVCDEKTKQGGLNPIEIQRNLLQGCDL